MKGTLFNNMTEFRYSRDGSGYVELDGCKKADMDGGNGRVYMQNITNKAYVGTSQEFVFSLYAYDDGSTYKIAQGTTKFSKFTTGDIKDFSVQQVDNVEVQGFTRFKVQFRPLHPIQKASVITITFPKSVKLVEGQCSLTDL